MRDPLSELQTTQEIREMSKRLSQSSGVNEKLRFLGLSLKSNWFFVTEHADCGIRRFFKDHPELRGKLPWQPRPEGFVTRLLQNYKDPCKKKSYQLLACLWRVSTKGNLGCVVNSHWL